MMDLNELRRMFSENFFFHPFHDLLFIDIFSDLFEVFFSLHALMGAKNPDKLVIFPPRNRWLSLSSIPIILTTGTNWMDLCSICSEKFKRGWIFIPWLYYVFCFHNFIVIIL